MDGRIPLAAILTGGAARRLGGRKADVPYQGVPLVERVWNAVRVVAGEVVCVGGEAYLAHRGVATLPDDFPGADSLGGVATALGYAARRFGPDAWVLVTACDMPHLSPRLLDLLCRSAAPDLDVVVPRTRLGYEPLCALYRARLRPALEEQIRSGNLRVRWIFGQAATREIEEEALRAVDPDLSSFRNLNRPEDFCYDQP